MLGWWGWFWVVVVRWLDGYNSLGGYGGVGNYGGGGGLGDGGYRLWVVMVVWVVGFWVVWVV